MTKQIEMLIGKAAGESDRMMLENIRRLRESAIAAEAEPLNSLLARVGKLTRPLKPSCEAMQAIQALKRREPINADAAERKIRIGFESA
ncbi:MAG TPA: hypothetical protein VKU44_06490 [Terriglobia bacterium]|nr:hypothetical protein [Terriglobia bacterium]